MKYRIFLLLILLFTFNSIECFEIFKQNTDECRRRIFEECHQTRPLTEEEIERARLFIQDKFYNEAELPPLRAPCKKLTIRRDFKCLTEAERQHFAAVVGQLYENGDITELGDIHQRYWRVYHLTAMALVHRVLVNELEKRMRKIDPDISLPYWNTANDFSDPKEALVFKYFGTNGTYSNGLCVEDGIFANLNLKRCLRRQWYDNRLPSWESPEMVTTALQYTDSYLGLLLMASYHFTHHLSIGGYLGDMSVSSAAYDILFYMSHTYQTENFLLKAQLNHPYLLTPVQLHHLLSELDPITGDILYLTGDLNTDVFPGFPNITALENWQIGFGDFCSVTDQVVSDINMVIRGETSNAVSGLQSLPFSTKAVFFPKLFTGKYNAFDYAMEEMPLQCNTGCKPMAKFQSFVDTAQGRRQLQAFEQDQFLTPTWSNILLLPQAFYYLMINELNLYRYCSPYVL